VVIEVLRTPRWAGARIGTAMLRVARLKPTSIPGTAAGHVYRPGSSRGTRHRLTDVIASIDESSQCRSGIVLIRRVLTPGRRTSCFQLISPQRFVILPRLPTCRCCTRHVDSFDLQRVAIASSNRSCRSWLCKQYFRPRVVHVERQSEVPGDYRSRALRSAT